METFNDIYPDGFTQTRKTGHRRWALRMFVETFHEPVGRKVDKFAPSRSEKRPGQVISYCQDLPGRLLPVRLSVDEK